MTVHGYCCVGCDSGRKSRNSPVPTSSERPYAPPWPWVVNHPAEGLSPPSVRCGEAGESWRSKGADAGAGQCWDHPVMDWPARLGYL